MHDRYLHFHLYDSGHAGMCNALMSLESALVLGMLTQRATIVYAPNTMYLTPKLFIDDLFDVDGISFRHHALSPGGAVLPEKFQTSCITNGRCPSEEYLFGRSTIIDLRDYQDAAHLSTADVKTLGWYSFLFCLTDEEKQRADAHVRNSIRPKQRYLTHVAQIVQALRSEFGRFNSIHLRRGDYLDRPFFRGSRLAAADFIDILLAHFPADEALLIHTDEEDESYFDAIKRHFPHVKFVDKALRQCYSDKVELGLVSLLVASHSDNFAGTMLSTFSEMIRRYRTYNGKTEHGLYLYSHSDTLGLVKGRMIESRPGENKWNRIAVDAGWQSETFWWRDWYGTSDCGKRE